MFESLVKGQSYSKYSVNVLDDVKYKKYICVCEYVYKIEDVSCDQNTINFAIFMDYVCVHVHLNLASIFALQS